MGQLPEEACGVHALYIYEETEDYLQQIETFIINGINAGEQVILIENERLYATILKEL